MFQFGECRGFGVTFCGKDERDRFMNARYALRESAASAAFDFVALDRLRGDFFGHDGRAFRVIGADRRDEEREKSPVHTFAGKVPDLQAGQSVFFGHQLNGKTSATFAASADEQIAAVLTA